MKIRNKFALSVMGVLIGLGAISLLLNLFFVERYYLYEQKKVLNQVETVFKNTALLQNNTQSDGAKRENLLNQLEEQYGVTIISATATKDIDALNENLMVAFEMKKMKLTKFWLTADTVDQLKIKSVNKLYDQGSSTYKVLIKFIQVEDPSPSKGLIYGIALPLPQMGQTLAIINRFNLILMTVALVVMMGLVYVISGRITAPLETLKVLADDLSVLKFRQVQMDQKDEKDEIGALSTSINQMSAALEEAHSTIQNQNDQLKQLMSDVSHELKTPLALAKAYHQGILDGLDDGSYHETLSEQIDKMDLLIEKLLYWSSIEHQVLDITEVDLKVLIQEQLQGYRIMLEAQAIDLDFDFETEGAYGVHADEPALRTVLDNFISNAIKYTANGKVRVSLSNKPHEGVVLTVQNGVSGIEKLDLKQIWQPFYVFEKSRNKALSGTGLGLPIVKAILDRHHFPYTVEIKNDTMTFSVTLM